jgi:signal transduction histidine kinase
MDVRATACDVAEAFRAEATAKHLTLSSNGGTERLMITSDQDRVRQVLANLISNAVKYTPSGGHIGVDVALEPSDSPTGGSAVVSVTDDGPGIPAEKQSMLFREFTRFDPGAAQGSGIGLAISQRVARALGGRITVESEAGRGSTFKLCLPLDPVPPGRVATTTSGVPG